MNASEPATRERVVTVYPMTGRQLFFTIPHRVCVECDPTIRLTRRVVSEVPGARLRVPPWFNHLFEALRRGGWHPPIVTVDGTVFSQGIVPDEAALRRALDPHPDADDAP